MVLTMFIGVVIAGNGEDGGDAVSSTGARGEETALESRTRGKALRIRFRVLPCLRSVTRGGSAGDIQRFAY